MAAALPLAIMEDMESLRGHLLLSAAGLWDPNFRKTIVLIGHHDEDGAVGVVLNRATDVSVAEAVPPLADLVPAGELLFIGGPVQPQAAVVLAEFEDPSRAEIIALDSIGFLPEEVDPDEIGGIRRARVFSGYSGWGAGQLEAELEEGSWIVEPAQADDVFADDPERLWDRVLRRKGGEFAILRTMPVDPSLN
jgi:putative transcriptional regulator